MSLLSEKKDQFVVDSGLVHDIVHGPASGAGSLVPTEGGDVRTVAKVVADAYASITEKSFAVSATEQFGARGDGVLGTEAAAIQSAIDFLYNGGSGPGGTVLIQRGKYMLETSINRRPGVYLRGEGSYATELIANGNFPAIQSIGTSGAGVQNRGGVSGMLIRGGGKANANAYGIREEWTNRTQHRDIRFHNCRAGMYAANVWQVTWDNLDADGAAGDQNYIGFYLAEIHPSNQNNAVRAVNCMAQGVEKWGFRLVNFNGSKFINCEATDGEHGWYLGDPTTGTEAIRWGHFTNCLADTTSSHGWKLEKGSATSFVQSQFTNCWAGNNGDNGWRVGGCSQLIFTSPMVVQPANRAFFFDQSSRCTVTGGQLLDANQTDTGQPALWLQDSQYITISGNHIYSTIAGSKAIIEYGSSDFNLAIGNTLHGDVTVLGANSKVYRNMGAGGERRGSAVVADGTTSVAVTHSLSQTPSINDIRITPRDDMGGATKFWVSNATSTQFTINVDVDPGADITFAWAVDPLLQ